MDVSTARRRRSKSLGRAQKRLNGTLQSQQQQDDEYQFGGAVGAAMEANSVWARAGVAAWPDCDAWRPQSMFDLYYRLIQLVERSEWESFRSSVRYVRSDV